MNLNRIVILIARETRRGKLNGRSFKVLLNRLGVGHLYRRPKDINLFKGFLENRQYAWGDHGENAVKFFFGLQGTRRVEDEKEGRLLRADLVRRVSNISGTRVIGRVSLNLKNNQLAYDIDQGICDEEGLDYVEFMGRAVEDYERERVVRLSEINVVAEALLRDIGFNSGPEWFVENDEDKLNVLREFAAKIYEWGYDFSIDEIDLDDLKKTSKKRAEIEKQAYDYVWEDVKRRVKRSRAVPVVFYRGVGFVVDKLVAENKIWVKNGKITVRPGVLNGTG